MSHQQQQQQIPWQMFSLMDAHMQAKHGNDFFAGRKTLPEQQQHRRRHPSHDNLRRKQAAGGNEWAASDGGDGNAAIGTTDQTSNNNNVPPFANAKELQKKIKRPPLLAQEPLSVKLGFYLESLGDFRETQMSFDVDLYMYMSWKDVTLAHSGHDMMMINDDSVRKQLWLPDLYFANARQANFHQVTIPNFNLFIAPDGTVAYSSRVTLTVACHLNLEDYPMDFQQCHIRVLSYAYIAKSVNVTWFRHQPILHNPDIDLPEFTIERVGAEYCDGTYRYAVTDKSYKNDQFSCLMANLYLRRRIGFNIVQSYIPTGLIVIISWVSFWIDRRSVPGRVTLAFTTMLTMTTIGNGMRFALPRVSYVKAIDYWFGGCMIFVFLALIEYALVNSYTCRSEYYERLANKYRRRSSAEMLTTLSPIFASELARSYAEMMRLRRKSTALGLLEGIKRTKSKSSVSLLSDDAAAEQLQSPKQKRKHKKSKEQQEEEEVGRNAAAAAEDGDDDDTEMVEMPAAMRTHSHSSSSAEKPPSPTKKQPHGKLAQQQNEWNGLSQRMDGSFYDNMQNSSRPPPIVVEQLPNGAVRRKMAGGTQNEIKQQSERGRQQQQMPPQQRNSSVAFAMDNGGYEAKGETEEEPDNGTNRNRSGWPRMRAAQRNDPKRGGGGGGMPMPDGEVTEEEKPQLYCKYLEVSQLLSKRADNIDRRSRCMFPTAFLLFNCIYWGYYLTKIWSADVVVN